MKWAYNLFTESKEVSSLLATIFVKYNVLTSKSITEFNVTDNTLKFLKNLKKRFATSTVSFSDINMSKAGISVVRASAH
jgi:hypothetical protein